MFTDFFPLAFYAAFRMAGDRIAFSCNFGFHQQQQKDTKVDPGGGPYQTRRLPKVAAAEGGTGDPKRVTCPNMVAPQIPLNPVV